jgi:hypothetical protein
MFAIEGKVIKNVIKVPLSDLFLLSKRKSLAILNDLMIVVYGPKLYSVWRDMKMPNRVMLTINRSN